MGKHVFAGILLALGAATAACPARAESTEPAPEAAAVVNGQSILKSEVDDGIPEQVFKSKVKLRLNRALKLERLIDLALQKQFVAKAGIQVAEAEIDSAIAEHRNRNTVSSCACGCSGYKSLEDFMAEKMMSMREYRDSILVGIGFKKHVDLLWAAEFKDPAKLAAEVETRKAELDAAYVRLGGIFFRNPDRKAGGEAMSADEKADAAWKRLEKGEDFAGLAAEASEDRATAVKGGEMGCLLKSQLVPDVLKAVEKLDSNSYSKPLKTWNGCVIVQRRPMERKESEEVLRAEFDRKARIDIINRMREGAKIEKR